MENIESLARFSVLAAVIAVQTAALGCSGTEAEPAHIQHHIHGLTEEATLAMPAKTVETATMVPVAAPRLQRSVDLAPQPTKVVHPPQEPNRRLYRSKEELGNFNADEAKDEEALPTRREPPAVSANDAAAYRRRGERYLKRWEEEKAKHAHLGPQEQDAIRAQLKHDIIEGGQ